MKISLLNKPVNNMTIDLTERANRVRVKPVNALYREPVQRVKLKIVRGGK